MGQVRNDFGEVRVLPTFDYAGVEPDRVLPVPDEDVYHWVAGGWTALTRYPVPHRLYPNHAGDPLAYALAEPDEDEPSALAVGTPPEAADGDQGQDDEPVDAPPQTAAAPTQTAAATAPTAAATAATAPTAASDPAPAEAAPAPADAKE